jgi:hypothetical protein
MPFIPAHFLVDLVGGIRGCDWFRFRRGLGTAQTAPGFFDAFTRFNPNSELGRDGALRRPRAVTGAERMPANVRRCQFLPTALRGRGQRSALSLPWLCLFQLRNSGSMVLRLVF